MEFFFIIGELDLSSKQNISKLQVKAAKNLREYSTNRYAVNPNKHTQLMLLLPRLMSLPPPIVEEIFLRK